MKLFNKISSQILLILALCFCSIYAADNNKVLKIGVNTDKMPISGYEHQKFIGIGVDIFKEIAQKLSLEYKFVPVKYGSKILDKMKNNDLDILIGPNTPHHYHSYKILYSSPFFVEGSQLFSKKNKITILEVLKILWTPLLYHSLLAALLIYTTFSYICYKYEAKNALKKEQIEKEKNNIIWNALFAFTGEMIKEPKTNIGKSCVFILIVTSMIMLSLLGASITSSIIQITNFSKSNIKNHADIFEKKVGVLQNEASLQNKIHRYNGFIKKSANYTELFQLLNDGDVDYILGNRSNINHFIRENHIPNIISSDFYFSKRFFSFVFFKNNNVYHDINNELIKRQQYDQNDKICDYYLPKSSHDCIL